MSFTKKHDRFFNVAAFLEHIENVAELQYDTIYNIAYTDHLTVTIQYWARCARCGEVSWNLSKTVENYEVF